MKSRVLLEVLSVLEAGSATTVQIHDGLQGLGRELTKRTTQRVIEELFAGRIIQAEKSRPPVYRALLNEDYRVLVLHLFGRFAQETAGNEIYGAIDAKIQSGSMEHIDKPAHFLTSLWNAARESRELTFRYQPQTRETFQKLTAKDPNNNKGVLYIEVRHIPRYMVFRGSHVLLLGETFRDNSINLSDNNSVLREVRQYEIRGIHDLKIGPCVERSLDFSPDDLYRDSMLVWTGGQVYEVELAEFDPLLNHIEKRVVKKVNGEHEILSECAASMGRLRIINPPVEILQYAEKIDLDTEKLFLFE